MYFLPYSFNTRITLFMVDFRHLSAFSIYTQKMKRNIHNQTNFYQDLIHNTIYVLFIWGYGGLKSSEKKENIKKYFS